MQAHPLCTVLLISLALTMEVDVVLRAVSLFLFFSGWSCSLDLCMKL